MKVYKFYAEWCGPCKMLSKVIQDAGDKVTAEIIDINIDEEMMTAVNFNVRGVPAMVMVDENDKEIKRLNGLVNEEKLLEFLNA